MGNISNFFDEKEFECKCGCGLMNMHMSFVQRLDAVRIIYGDEIIISSGCRCAKHNKKVGGSRESSHLEGLAVDIRVKNSVERFHMVEAAMKAGIGRIGVAVNFMHLDGNIYKLTNCFWTYRKQEKKERYLGGCR